MARRRLKPLEYAVYLLGRRARSKAELERKLTDKGYETEEVAAVVARLLELKLIDDTVFAKNYAQDKVRIYRRGRYRIALELIQKGVPKNEIDNAVAEIDEVDELEAAISLLKSRDRSWQKLDGQTRYRRAMSLLLRRGFSGAVVKAALKAQLNP